MSVRSTPGPDPRRLPLLLLLVACVALALAAAAVSARLSAASPQPARAALGASSLQLPDGAVAVLAVTPERMAHAPGMPAAMMPGDPLSDDERRVTVQLVLTAGADGLSFAGGDFRLAPAGAVGSAPERDGLGEGRLPAGYRMDGELVFRVPAAADALVLTEARSGRTVDVAVAEGTAPAGHSPGGKPSTTASPHPHGHDAPHGASAPATPRLRDAAAPGG